MNPIIDQLAVCVERGKFDKTVTCLADIESQDGADELARLALEQNMDPNDILKGCMIGMELTGPGADFVKRCMQAGLLINCTHDTVIRFYPSMCATPEEIEQGAAIVEEVLGAGL